MFSVGFCFRGFLFGDTAVEVTSWWCCFVVLCGSFRKWSHAGGRMSLGMHYEDLVLSPSLLSVCV